MIEFRTLNADDIECRIGTCTEKGISLLLYKNARVDMALLDEVVGAENWQRHHSRDNANCVVAIWDAEKNQWIEKEDTGTESNTEAEKGLCSDSFKRACVNWGIGRELYTAPFTWVGHDKIPETHKQYNGKWTCKEKFTVENITYDGQRRINGLTIADSKGNIVFNWASAEKKDAVKQKMESKPKQEAEVVGCEMCGMPIKGTVDKKGNEMPAGDVIAFSMKKYGKCLCSSCMKRKKAIDDLEQSKK